MYATIRLCMYYSFNSFSFAMHFDLSYYFVLWPMWIPKINKPCFVIGILYLATINLVSLISFIKYELWAYFLIIAMPYPHASWEFSTLGPSRISYWSWHYSIFLSTGHAVSARIRASGFLSLRILFTIGHLPGREPIGAPWILIPMHLKNIELVSY